MSPRRSAALLAMLAPLSVQGCTASTPPAVVAPPPAPAPAAPPPPVPVTKGPSEALRAHWPFEESPDFAIYADVEGLLHTPLAAGVLPGVRVAAKGSLNAQQLQCLDDVLGSVKEVLVGQKGDDAVTLVRFDESVAAPTNCLATMSATGAELPGVKEAYRVPDGPIVHLPGLLVMGSDAEVLRAVQQQGPRATPATLALSTDEYLAWSFQQQRLGSAKGHVLASAARFKVELDADVPEGLARKLEADVHAARGAPASPGTGSGDAPLLAALVGAVTLTRDGGHVHATYDLAEPVEAQARDLGVIASLTAASVRKYVAAAKAAEARAMVVQVGRFYSAYWDRDPKAHPKRLASFPAVPKEVPRGVKYASTPADWKPWQPLAFSMEEPQYFQYSVVASKDGKSAEIDARGDLNGDGKTSLFRLRLHVDPKTRALVIDPKVEETDPEE